MSVMLPNKNALVIGDTSSFHLCSNQNYLEFRKLVKQKYNIVGEIPYNEFGTVRIDYPLFVSNLKESKWHEAIQKAGIFIVHGEGLTEKQADFAYHYLYFSRIAKERDLESHLVNFSMFEVDPFLELVKNFDYVACRDIITHRLLKSRKIDSELSFDCAILSSPLQGSISDDGHIALIRGRNEIPLRFSDNENYVKYNCCWSWEVGSNAVTYSSFQEYLPALRNARFSLTTSFHANIISFLSSIPFISLDKTNPKYLALDLELLPNDLRNPDSLRNPKNRMHIQEHYKLIYPELKRRAKLNLV